MMQGKTLIIMLVVLVVGFAVGFVLRPVIAPTQQTAAVANFAPVSSAAVEARSTQYFTAHPDEAREVVAACREGSLRGGECSNADAAVIRADAQARSKKFLGN
jgi:hypothetical protein